MNRILFALFIVFTVGMSIFVAIHQFEHIDDLGIGKDILESKTVEKFLSFFLDELDFRGILRVTIAAKP